MTVPLVYPKTLESVPGELKEGTFHMCWSYEIPPGRKSETKVPKVALRAGSKQASSTNPDTWRPLEDAIEAYGTGRYHGVARAVTAPYIGVDVDDCINPASGEIDARGAEIVEALEGYTEVSPSGTGVKIWVKGEIPRNYKKDGLEVYNGGRYFTLTGEAFGAAPETVPERTVELRALITREFPEKPKKPLTVNPERNGGDGLDDLLAEWNVPVSKVAPDGSADKKYAVRCPFLHEHSDGDDSGTFVGEYPSGAKFFHCHHAHCEGRDFKAFAHEVMPAKVNITMNGHRAREEREQPKPSPARPFPEMDSAAYRGVFGELVELISPHSEADPVAILLGAITAFGSAYGRRGYVDVSGARHHGNLFVGIVGDTARARKGTSWAPIENIFSSADPEWAQKRIDSGLSSGEGLISAVRDKIEVPDGEGDTKVSDPGVKDKRLLVSEGELSQGLKVLRREGNTLSPVLRNAWDGRDLSTMVKHSPLRATAPHISVVGHITSTELLKHVVESEAANGFANRFLWAVVRRSKKLPFGGDLDRVDMAPVVRKIRDALSRDAGRMRFAESARDTWIEMYDALTEDRPGMFGQVTARAEAQTLRLAILYALADGSAELEAEHLASAYAVWGYCEDSALYLFGDQLGDADADKLLEALRDSEEGMTRTQIRDLFGRNKKPEDLQRVLGLLQDTGKAYAVKEKPDGGGRPSEVWWVNE
jgi:hypothetical protein